MYKTLNSYNIKQYENFNFFSVTPLIVDIKVADERYAGTDSYIYIKLGNIEYLLDNSLKNDFERNTENRFFINDINESTFRGAFSLIIKPFWGIYDAMKVENIKLTYGNSVRQFTVNQWMDRNNPIINFPEAPATTPPPTPAPVDCVMTEWVDFSRCSKACGGTGTKKQYRGVSIRASNGGIECPTDLIRTVSCNTQPCPTLIAVGLDKMLYTGLFDNNTLSLTQVPNSGSVQCVCVMGPIIVGVGMDGFLYTKEKLTWPWVQVANSNSVINISIMSKGYILGVGMDGFLFTKISLGPFYNWIPYDTNTPDLISACDIGEQTILAVDRRNNLWIKRKTPGIPGTKWLQRVTNLKLINVSFTSFGILGVDTSNKLWKTPHLPLSSEGILTDWENEYIEIVWQKIDIPPETSLLFAGDYRDPDS